jgi:hypothetical protein
VQCTTSSFQLHVSGAPLTGVKSFSPRARQPSPVPSMNAFGNAVDWRGSTAIAKFEYKTKTAKKYKPRDIATMITPFRNNGLDER